MFRYYHSLTIPWCHPDPYHQWFHLGHCNHLMLYFIDFYFSSAVYSLYSNKGKTFKTHVRNTTSLLKTLWCVLIQNKRQTSLAVFNLSVSTNFYLPNIYTMILNSRKIISWLRVTTIWGTVLKGHSFRMFENNCSSLQSPRWLVCTVFPWL